MYWCAWILIQSTPHIPQTVFICSPECNRCETILKKKTTLGFLNNCFALTKAPHSPHFTSSSLDNWCPQSNFDWRVHNCNLQILLIQVVEKKEDNITLFKLRILFKDFKKCFRVMTNMIWSLSKLCAKNLNRSCCLLWKWPIVQKCAPFNVETTTTCKKSQWRQVDTARWWKLCYARQVFWFALECGHLEQV